MNIIANGACLEFLFPFTSLKESLQGSIYLTSRYFSNCLPIVSVLVLVHANLANGPTEARPHSVSFSACLNHVCLQIFDVHVVICKVSHTSKHQGLA